MDRRYSPVHSLDGRQGIHPIVLSTHIRHQNLQAMCGCHDCGPFRLGHSYYGGQRPQLQTQVLSIIQRSRLTFAQNTDANTMRRPHFFCLGRNAHQLPVQLLGLLPRSWRHESRVRRNSALLPDPSHPTATDAHTAKSQHLSDILAGRFVRRPQISFPLPTSTSYLSTDER